MHLIKIWTEPDGEYLVAINDYVDTREEVNVTVLKFLGERGYDVEEMLQGFDYDWEYAMVYCMRNDT